MRLDELEWVEARQNKRLADVLVGTRQIRILEKWDGTYFINPDYNSDIYNSDQCWDYLDAFTAQCVLYALVQEGDDEHTTSA